MIHELAAFENATSSVKATEASLLNTLSFPKTSTPESFSDFTPGFARTLLILGPSTSASSSELAVAGMALFFTNYSTWQGAPGIYLEDLFITPPFRRRGYAQALLKELARITEEIGGKRLEWSCLRWNEGALGFYKNLGAERMEEWVGLRVEGNALGTLANGQGK
jgi:ribosomal protein S18 acetylase RimI-like enzyme